MEIERKFLVTTLPSLTMLVPVRYAVLKTLATNILIRDSYNYLPEEDLELSIKVYHGTYEGLVRV